jgi:hypothetical protein
MGTYKATWEDEDNNRLVQFSVDYTTENGSVEIASVTPTKVTFVCQETNTFIRSIGVHTNAGRALLAKQFEQSGRISDLAAQVAARTEFAAAV